MKRMLWSDSVKFWKGDNTTKLFPFDFNTDKEEKRVLSGIEYKLSKKQSSGECVDISDELYSININESSNEGTLNYPTDDVTLPLLENEELILYIHMTFKEE